MEQERDNRHRVGWNALERRNNSTYSRSCSLFLNLFLSVPAYVPVLCSPTVPDCLTLANNAKIPAGLLLQSLAV